MCHNISGMNCAQLACSSSVVRISNPLGACHMQNGNTYLHAAAVAGRLNSLFRASYYDKDLMEISNKVSMARSKLVHSA